jgi:FKBP-type peptidyl-prolyl cis-trans isomerase SlpA
VNAERCIRLGDRVRCHYRLTCAGEEVASTFCGEAEGFTLGHGEIDPRLESLLLDLKVGDIRQFDLEPWQAFGARDAALVQSLPRDEFPAESRLEPGLSVEFDLPNGEQLIGHIESVSDDSVTVDFNHPLAGLPVRFECEIVAIE